MFNFVICEDNIEIRDKIYALVKDYCDIKSLNYIISTLDEPFKLSSISNILNNTKSTNIYLLDIVLNKRTNGIKIAAEIRKKDLFGFIIFITDYKDFQLDALRHRIRPYDYIWKRTTNLDEDIKTSIDNIFEELEKMKEKNIPDTLLVIKNGISQVILLDDVLYFKGEPHSKKLIARTKDSRIEFIGTLQDIEEETRSNNIFQFCQNSLLINLNHVQFSSSDLDAEEPYITLNNSEKYIVSKEFMKGIKNHDVSKH